MNLAPLSRMLRQQADALRGLLAGVDAEQATFRADGKGWNLLEITCHLADEERDDFRARVDLTLHDPGRAWSPIDPEGWVGARGYGRRTLPDALADFLREREASLAWLAGLRAPDWTRAHDHPRLGTLRAGDLLAAWAAHDALHLRQIARVRRAYVDHLAAPFDARYAG